MQFSDDDFLLTSAGGVRWYMRQEEDGTVHIGSSHDIDPILDANAAIANHSDGWNHDKTFRHIGRVPHGLIEQWSAEDGIDFYNENCAKEVIRRLNSSEYHKLRTSHWKV